MMAKPLDPFLLFPTLQSLQWNSEQNFCCLVKEPEFHSSVLQVLTDGQLAGFLSEQALVNLTGPTSLGCNSQSFTALNLPYLAQMGTGVDQQPAHSWTQKGKFCIYEQRFILGTRDRRVLTFPTPACSLSKSLGRRGCEFPCWVTLCSPDFKPGRNEGKTRRTQRWEKLQILHLPMPFWKTL